MPSLAHRSKVRRAERSVILRHGNINLVPLVDILTSIVFFSLLTYTGEQLMRLTAYDLMLPPTVITADQADKTRGAEDLLNLLLAVRVEPNRYVVEHSEENGFRQEIARGPQALDQLQSVMTQIRQKYTQNRDVTVVPSDEVVYDDLVKVLERLRVANYTGISLANRARGEQTTPRTTTSTAGGEVTR
jgi:biopolymer transport protein ExbD